MGSAKDIYIIFRPTIKKMGVGAFKFSDRYSIFDWGEMPDTITNKGKALCMISAHMFEEAERKGMNTHYRGLMKGNELLTTRETDEPLDLMEFDMVRVIKPIFEPVGYNYNEIKKEKTNFLIPLEIIYRNSLPKGSSIFKRLAKGEIEPEEIGLDHYPEPGEILKKPIFDVSTKLESRDRYISWKEAGEITGLNEDTMKEVFHILENTNEMISDACNRTDMINEDGKIELARDSNGKIMLADVFGTPDECRFTKSGINMSKEISRQYYNETGWAKEVENVKRFAHSAGLENWKGLCTRIPENLDGELKEIISNAYTSIANEFIGRKIFDSPRTQEVVNRYKDWLDAIDMN